MQSTTPSGTFCAKHSLLRSWPGNESLISSLPSPSQREPVQGAPVDYRTFNVQQKLHIQGPHSKMHTLQTPYAIRGASGTLRGASVSSGALVQSEEYSPTATYSSNVLLTFLCRVARQVA